MPTISPTQSNVTNALRQFLLAILPAGTEVVLAQPNRVPQPTSNNQVIITPLRVERIETNQDSSQDVKFAASIAGQVMTVTEVAFGSIDPGATLFGVGLPAVPITVNLQTGGEPGGPGTYQISQPLTLAQQTLAAGQKAVQQNSKWTLQCDFHSLNNTTAADMAMTASTLLRDEYGVDFFAALVPPLDGVVPLYADDPRQAVFQDEAQQSEWRWTLDCLLQANHVVSIPAQFYDSVTVVTKSVEATFPF